MHCAVDVQRGMAERNSGVPANHRIEFRIGINIICVSDVTITQPPQPLARFEAL
jgi:hypothetical protein